MNKKKIWIFALIGALLIIGICLWAGGCFESNAPKPTEPTTQPTETAPITQAPTAEPTTEATEAPTSAPTEATVVPTTGPAKETEPRPSVTEPATTAPVTTQPAAKVTDPMEVLALAKSKIRGLSGNATEVGSVSNPKYLNIQVSATEDAQSASQKIVDQIKATLAYEQSQANPNVAVGNPNPFTYDYNLSYVSTENGQHSFRFAYHFVSVNYEVPEQSYETSRLVAEVRAHLDGLGKVRFDSQSSEYTSKQPVIILKEYSYDTAASIAKAQVESISAAYSSYDFYYAALTVTTKGGVEKEALCFYIVNK